MSVNLARNIKGANLHFADKDVYISGPRDLAGLSAAWSQRVSHSAHLTS
jgi:hypothetical protein